MLIERVRAFRPGELKVSVVTQYELEYGVRRSDRMDELGLVVAAFLGNVEVLPFEGPAAAGAGQVEGAGWRRSDGAAPLSRGLPGHDRHAEDAEGGEDAPRSHAQLGHRHQRNREG